MATCFERVEQLRILLGQSQDEFMEKVGKGKSTYSMWKSGTQAPHRDTLFAMADRWFVDYDSLWGRPGTDALVAAPELQLAQERLVGRLSRTDTICSRGERVVLCYNLLAGAQGILPSLTESSWAEWLHWSSDDWDSALVVPDLIGTHQVDGAAFFCGWYAGQARWSTWFETGRAAELRPIWDDILRVIAQRVASSDLDVLEVRRRLNV